MAPIDEDSDLKKLEKLIQLFVSERDWGQFNSPKNLASALCVEAGELLEPFQWLLVGNRAELGEEKLEHVRHEMADVLIYLISLAHNLDIDLKKAVLDKMEINRGKYPVDIVKGDARKYNEY